MAEPFRGIDIEGVTVLLVEALLHDPEGRDVSVESADYLKVIYAWHQQEMEQLRKRVIELEQIAVELHTPRVTVADQLLGSGQKIPRPARTMCELGRPLRDHARPCAPACDFRSSNPTLT